MSVTKKLRTAFVLSGAAWTLSGCVMAAPTMFQITTTAMDGASYAATGKSVTDHLVSEVTAKDCVMMRALDGEDICKERPEGKYDRMPDGTKAPNAIDAALGVKPAEEDQRFQSFAATQATGDLDDAEILDAPAQDSPLPTAPAPSAGWSKPEQGRTPVQPAKVVVAQNAPPQAEPANQGDQTDQLDMDPEEDTGANPQGQSGDFLDDEDEALTPEEIRDMERAMEGQH